MEACKAGERVCEQGCGQGWELPPEDSLGFIPGETEDPAEVQCKCSNASVSMQVSVFLQLALIVDLCTCFEFLMDLLSTLFSEHAEQEAG